VARWPGARDLSMEPLSQNWLYQKEPIGTMVAP
jgi:hypothetical protein